MQFAEEFRPPGIVDRTSFESTPAPQQSDPNIYSHSFPRGGIDQETDSGLSAVMKISVNTRRYTAARVTADSALGFCRDLL